MKLFVDELDTGVKILQRCRLGVQRAIKAVENGEQRPHRIGERVVPVLLLLLFAALAIVFELSLNARRAIEIRSAFGANPLQLRSRLFRRGRADAALGSGVISTRSEERR